VATYRIPLINGSQRFTIALGGITYQLSLSWCTVGAVWLVSVADYLGNPLVSSLPLVLGTDLLEPYPELGFPGELVAYNGPETTDPATYEDLGVTGELYFITPE